MRYRIVFSDRFKKIVNKLDNSTYSLLNKWITKHLIECENPKQYGKPLSANLKGLWRYRIGNNRLIVKIEDDELIVLVIDFVSRSNIYR